VSAHLQGIVDRLSLQIDESKSRFDSAPELVVAANPNTEMRTPHFVLLSDQISPDDQIRECPIQLSQVTLVRRCEAQQFVVQVLHSLEEHVLQ
jgi:hypothetical protein